MKRFIAYLAAIAAGLAVAFCNFGCVQTETVAPDGTITRSKQPAPGVLQFAGAAITAYSPRPIKVREEKSARITDKEIANRWRPVFGPEMPKP
jgi:hypothetical protein